MFKKIIVLALCFFCFILSACTEQDPPPVETSGKTDTETDPAVETDTWAIYQEKLQKAIDKDLALLVPEGSPLLTEEQYIGASPDAFETIVSYGEGALPYLTELANQAKSYDSSIENYRRYMAKYAAYTISPSLYDRIYTSPDGKHTVKLAPTSFVTEQDPFMGTEYLLTVSDTQTGDVIVSAENIYVIPSEEQPVLWSPDGKYALLSQTYRHAITSLHITDIQNAVYYDLPHKAELEAALGKELVYHDTETGHILDTLHLYFGTWGNKTITVRMSLSSSVGGSADIGEYTYDLESKTISDIDADLLLDAPAPGEPENDTQTSPKYQSFYTETEGYGITGYDNALGKEFHHFYHTSDAGETWTETDTNIDMVYPAVVTGISFRDTSVGFIVYRYDDYAFMPAVLKTTDGGKTWEKQINICELLQEYTDQYYNLAADPPQFSEDGRCTMEIKGTLRDNPSDTVHVTIESDDGETWTITSAVHDSQNG